jgi:fibronectin type 3 domain-containing protein
MMITCNRILIFLLAAGIVLAGCSNDIEPPSGIPAPPAQPETPRDLTASIGDGIAAINWAVNNTAAVDHYVIYSSDSASVEGMRLLDSTDAENYTVNNLINGKRYYFRVTAVDNSGLEGEMSDVLSLVPGLFSITIEDYSVYTSTRSVSISFIAPAGTDLVEMSEDSNFITDVHIHEFANTLGFELSDGDGVKKVYACFELTGGGSSVGFVSDSIILDRVAIIDSITESSNGVTLSANSVVHFAVYTSEPGGEASVEVAGLGVIGLNDLGVAGDITAADGIYEVDYVIPINTELEDAEVMGSFIDAAGNNAAVVKSSTLLNVTGVPGPITLDGFSISSMEILLEWTRSPITDFSGYRLFRSGGDSVNQSSDLITTITDQSILSYSDTGLQASTTYYYRLYVYDHRGNFTGSDSLEISTKPNEAPDSITIAVRLTGDTLTAELTWVEATDTDFESYRVLRDNLALPVDYDAAKVIRLINDRSTTTFADKLPAADQYYYQIYVFDRQGMKTGSNIVSINVP